jgi:hypothetical protein
MIDLALFNKLRKESGDDWYVFIGSKDVPKEWKGLCESWDDRGWCDYSWDGNTPGHIYRIRVSDMEPKPEESLPKVVSLPLDWRTTDHPRVLVRLGEDEDALCSHVMCSIGQVHYHNGHEYRLFGFGFCMWEENELSEAYFHAPFVVGRPPEKCVYAYFKRIDE